MMIYHKSNVHFFQAKRFIRRVAEYAKTRLHMLPIKVGRGADDDDAVDDDIWSW